MKIEKKKGITVINLEKEEKVLIEHDGSVESLKIGVDEFDDIYYNILRITKKGYK